MGFRVPPPPRRAIFFPPLRSPAGQTSGLLFVQHAAEVAALSRAQRLMDRQEVGLAVALGIALRQLLGARSAPFPSAQGNLRRVETALCLCGTTMALDDEGPSAHLRHQTPIRCVRSFAWHILRVSRTGSRSLSR